MTVMASEFLMQIHALCKDRNLIDLDQARNYLNTQCTWKSENERQVALAAERIRLGISSDQPDAQVVERTLSAKGAALADKFNGTVWMHNPGTGARVRATEAQVEGYAHSGYIAGRGPNAGSSEPKQPKPAKMVKLGGRGKGGVGTKWMYKDSDVRRVKESEIATYEGRGYKFGKKPV